MDYSIFYQNRIGGEIKMKARNLQYESNFRKYIYSFDYETHKKIAANLGLIAR